VLLTTPVYSEVFLFGTLVVISDLLKPTRAHGRPNNERGHSIAVITLTWDITIFYKYTNIFYIIILFISSLLRLALIKY
jgi:hypothetical protein